MRVLVVTPPDPVISLEEAKEHLRVKSNDQDAVITALVAAATGHLDGPDGWLGRAIGVQTLEMRCNFFRDAMTLRYPPIIDVVSVKHLDAEGAEVTLLASEYEVRGHLIGSSFGKRWPSVGLHDEAVRVRYRAGYVALPPALRAAILLMVGDLFANRETAVVGTIGSAVPMSTTVERLLEPLRVYA